MRTSTLLGLGSALVASVATSPVHFPLPDGFPEPNPDQIAEIQQKAGGSLPNGPLPSSLKDGGHTALQLIALNEIFEVAFFTDLLANITEGKPGYDEASMAPLTRDYAIEIITAVVNQEELHATGVNAALKNSNFPPIQPCSFQFPVDNFADAITLAQTFTDLVLSTLPQAQALFASDGGDESALVPLFGSVIGQEGEQNGFYRLVQKKTPSAAPFLTGGAPEFAFSALQSFIVPDSCPQPLSDIALTTFKPLTVVTKAEAKTMTLRFSIPAGPDVGAEGNSLVYLSGQNLPVTVPISQPTYANGVATFEAEFPFEAEARFANGLTIAAVVKGHGPFSSGAEVAKATVNGPGLIEVD